MNKIEEKYEALCRYIDYINSYDIENLKVLSFPKEDSVFIKVACEKQIAKNPTPRAILEETSVYVGDGYFSSDLQGKCPCCETCVTIGDDHIFCRKCGQRLEWKRRNEKNY